MTTFQAISGPRLLGAALLLGLSPGALAGAYIFAGDDNGIDLITHPQGYAGFGGELQVDVCIVPGSPNAQAMQVPVHNAVRTWNDLEPTSGNLALNANNDIPTNFLDFESVVLHEIGHCIGLAHPNAATESGLPNSQRDYTKATTGSNGVFDLNDGADDVIGSADDIRGDDQNLHWFRMANNNPFTIAPVVDGTTYARDLLALPPGDNFAANADRTVGALLGFPNTEAVMQQGQFIDEAQRSLVHDDVATIELGKSGVDEAANTTDDYTIHLVYRGISDDAGCDLNVSFNDAQVSFAACFTGGVFIAGGHAAITSADTFYNNGFNWYFNPEPNGGDLNDDDCIDRSDYSLAAAAIRGGSTEDTYDFNSDGQVNIADQRTLVNLFTNPRGAPCA